METTNALIAPGSSAVDHAASALGRSLESTQTCKPLDDFNMSLNTQPKKEHVKVNKMADNTLYLPISHLETLLDQYYMGLWETKNFESKVVGNEVMGSIQLRVFHPIAKMWVERTGSAAVPVRFKKDTDITNVNNKIKNALVQDYPHLKSECMKNAAKSLGKAFGRDLNRQFTDTYVQQVLARSPEQALTALQDTVDGYDDFETLKAHMIKLKDTAMQAGVTREDAERIIKEKVLSLREKQ